MDDISLNFSPESLTILNVCLAFIMFSVALHLRWENLKYVFANPRSVAVGLTSQLLFLPALTLLLIWLIDPHQHIAMGMMLVAACPGGNVSNFFTLIGRGNIALSITLTTITSLTSAFTTPLLFVALAALTLKDGTAGEFDLPFMDTLVTIFFIIVVPALSGMLFVHRFPRWTDKLKSPLQSLSMLVLVGFIAFALKANFAAFLEHIGLIFWIVAIHNLLAFAGAYTWARLWRRPQPDRLTIGMETSIQNTALGLVITFNFFDGNGPMAIILAWWGVWHLIAGYTYALLFRGTRIAEGSQNLDLGS
jgi:BASS family bile acid:Na+ symporter